MQRIRLLAHVSTTLEYEKAAALPRPLEIIYLVSRWISDPWRTAGFWIFFDHLSPGHLPEVFSAFVCTLNYDVKEPRPIANVLDRKQPCHYSLGIATIVIPDQHPNSFLTHPLFSFICVLQLP